MAEATAAQRHDAESEKEQELGGRMSFVAHLQELRVRVRNAVIGVIVGFIGCFGFSDQIFDFLLRPVGNALFSVAEDHPGYSPQLQSIDVTGPFWAHFSVSLWASVFVASPIIFYQVWQFVAPGLYKKERRWGIAFALTSALCFCSGALFCYYVVLEPVITFLVGYSMEDVKIVVNPDALRLVKFCRKILIGFGLAFELPLIITVLALAGAVTHRGLWKFNRYWIVIAVILSAMLTPPDIFSQLVMAGPLVILYNLSIAIAYFITKNREAKIPK